jgi:formamidopyrimidine-DNA glycosylase
MPELPEVEVIRRGLAPVLVGHRFAGVRLGRHRLRRQSGLLEFDRWVVGRTLEAITRRGKYLLFHLEGKATLLVHLGMTGRLLLGPGGDKPAPHVHLTFRFDDGVLLRFQDVRRFGQILVFPPGQYPEPLDTLGLEPFSQRATPAWLLSLARGRTKPLKNFLLDGRALAGIGNIYACEILFAAKLSPTLPSGRLSLAEWERLLHEARRILRMAIRRGGTTVADYLNSRGETGLFQLDLAVYGREGEPCPRCGTPVSRRTQAGRSTFFCPRCQRTRPPKR